MIRLAAITEGIVRLRRLRREQGGYSLPELTVAILVGTAIFGGLFTLINVSVRSNAQTTGRVAVDQLARPAMQRIVDSLHSACVYPGLAPIQAGSTGSQISFISAMGSAANPTPTLHRITLSPSPTGVLTDVGYQLTGTAPNWTPTSTVVSRFTLLNRAAQINGSTPVFRYYKYVNGAISTTPLPTSGSGLTAENAKLAVQVTVAFKTSLSQGAQTLDDEHAATLSESVLLRFSPSNEDTNKAGLPCT